MRCLFVMGAVVSSGCRTTAPKQGFHWAKNSQPSVGVTMEIDREWQTTAIDNTVLLAPKQDDFAILLVRAAEQSADVLGKLATLDHVAMKPLAATPPVQMQSGTAMLRGNHRPVALRVARITDAGTHATYIVALIERGSDSRGIAAFDHVVKSLVITGSDAQHGAYPAWLAPTESKPGADEGSDDDSSDADDGATP